MDFVHTLGGGAPRYGRHERLNDQRFFYVPGQGWYALTREGIGGPFMEQQDAERFVRKVIAGEILPQDQEERNVSNQA